MKTHPLSLSTLALLLLSTLACAGGKDAKDPGDEADADTDADTDADSDADADTDADSDADTDADTDTDPPRECDETESICDGDACDWDVVADVYDVSGAVTYEGARPPTYSGYDDFTVYFTDTDSSRRYAFGGENGAYAAALPGGTYDVSLVLLNLGTEGVCYDEILVREDRQVDDDATLDLDAEVYDVSGDVTYEGAPPPSYSGYDDFTVYFTDTDSGARYAFSGENGAYAAAVPGGTYDVSLVLLNLGTEGVCYDEILVREDRQVDDDATLDLDAEVFDVSGDVTYEGAAPPAYSGYDDFTVYFTDTRSGQRYAFAGENGAYAAAVPDGTYDISIVLLNLGTEGVCYDEIVVREARPVDTDTTLDLDADVFDISGRVTYDGARPPTYSGYDDFTVYFTDTDSGARFAFPGENGAYAAALPGGTYDVSLLLLNLGTEGVCYDEMLVREDKRIDADGTVNVDAEVFDRSGDVTYQGEPPPSYSGYDDFTVYFTDTSSGRRYAYAGEDGAYAAAVPSGTYDVSITLLNLGTEGVCYDEIRVRSNESVSSDDTLDLSAEVFDLAGSVTYEGARPPTYSGYDDFTVSFTDILDGHRYAFGGDNGTYAAALPAGVYDVSLTLLNLGTEGVCYDEIPVGECIEVG